jgi:ribosomal protein S18 acetylase RimI-like enzyme
MIEEYIRHPETKSLGPDGTTCVAETRGLLQRAHITAGRIRYIDKETSSMWAQSDDLSVLTDNEESGFRVVEYGKSRKVVLPDSLKREIKETKLQRELRRRGIGQHTLEKALHARVRLNTYKNIVSAIEDYKREKVHDPERKSHAIQRRRT